MTAGDNLYHIWVYLSETPLLWLTATLLAYAIGDAISRSLRRHPLANPVMIAAALLIVVLTSTGTAYQTYFQGAQFVHFLLGPATVALGLPLWRNRLAVRRNFLPMVAALFAGSLTAIGSAVAIAWAFGAPPDDPRLARRQVGDRAHRHGADRADRRHPRARRRPRGADRNPRLGDRDAADEPLAHPRLRRPRLRGGIASHGIGTARAFQVSEEAGTFAGIAMGLNGALTALVFAVLALAL